MNLRHAFADRARLVSVEHGGHGVYLAAGDACADRVGTDFLVTGRRPAADLTYPAEHAGLRDELAHLTTVDGTPGALAEVRDGHGLGYQTRGGVTTDGRAVGLVHTTAPSTSEQWGGQPAGR